MPEHRHLQKQIVHILQGRMRLIVDGMPHELVTGDSFYLASNVPHGVETIEETRVLDLSINRRCRHSFKVRASDCALRNTFYPSGYEIRRTAKQQFPLCGTDVFTFAETCRGR